MFGVAHGIQSFVPRMLAGGEQGYVINTSSGDGAIAPMPMASIYAASKSAVAIMTECLAGPARGPGHQPAGLAVPAQWARHAGDGPVGFVGAGNRPPELAREPRPTKPQTIEGLQEQAKAAGREIPLQDLNELGRDVLEQIKTGVYCIQMNGNGPSAQRLHERGRPLRPGPQSDGPALTPATNRRQQTSYALVC